MRVGWNSKFSNLLLFSFSTLFDLQIFHPTRLLVIFFYPTHLFGPTLLWNLLKISTLLVYLAPASNGLNETDRLIFKTMNVDVSSRITVLKANYSMYFILPMIFMCIISILSNDWLLLTFACFPRVH